MHALFHFYLPFPKKLGQVMHFCISNCANLMETCFNLTHIFSLVVPYSHVLENKCPKQHP